jgi:large subunit ribosomal protein L25
MPEDLQVQTRSQLGKHNNRRLRRDGNIPTVLYGHGLENLPLAVSAIGLDTVLRRGSRLVNLTGAVNESAFIREVQWNTLGTHILHVDLTRISMHEKVEVQVTVELRGEAPGVREGGVVDQLVHHVNIECPAGSIPEKILVNINNLKLTETIGVTALELPEGARVLGDQEAVVVQCIIPVEKPEEMAGEAMAVEPEVIGEKKEKEEDEE